MLPGYVSKALPHFGWEVDGSERQEQYSVWEVGGREGRQPPVVPPTASLLSSFHLFRTFWRFAARTAAFLALTRGIFSHRVGNMNQKCVKQGITRGEIAHARSLPLHRSHWLGGREAGACWWLCYHGAQPKLSYGNIKP